MLSNLFKGIQAVRIDFFLLKVVNIRCFILIAIEIFHKAYFLNLASCSEHFISIKHRILATFNIKKNQF